MIYNTTVTKDVIDYMRSFALYHFSDIERKLLEFQIHSWDYFEISDDVLINYFNRFAVKYD